LQAQDHSACSSGFHRVVFWLGKIYGVLSRIEIAMACNNSTPDPAVFYAHLVPDFEPEVFVSILRVQVDSHIVLDPIGTLGKMDLHKIQFTGDPLIGDENVRTGSPSMEHSSIKVTVDVCGHKKPGGNRQAVNKPPGSKSATQMKLATKLKKGGNMSLPSDFCNILDHFDLGGGADETRTRDLRRDRPAF
jgi:hypothetical protein